MKPTAAATPVANTAEKKSSNRVLLFTVVGIAALAAIVATRHSSSTTTNETTPAPTESASSQASTSMTSASPAASTAATTSTNGAANALAPVGIVAHYTTQGATIFWAADASAEGLTNFNIEVRSNGGTWKLISTVPASQTSLDIVKKDTQGWMSFRVSAVYSDGTVVGGKVFGLPGQYA